MNIQKARKGLLALMKIEGYTKNSYAKKCSVDETLFKLFFKENVKLRKKDIDYIINKSIVYQGLSLEDLEEYVRREDESAKIKNEEILKEQKKYKSRDIDRIEPFLDEFKDLWLSKPDLRFGQLVESLANKIAMDSFYAEDDVWIEAIRDMK